MRCELFLLGRDSVSAVDRLVAALRTEEDRAMAGVMLLGGVAPPRGVEAAVVTVYAEGLSGQPLLHPVTVKRDRPEGTGR